MTNGYPSGQSKSRKWRILPLMEDPHVIMDMKYPDKRLYY